MKILVINSGSSSIKYKLFENDTIILGDIKEEIKNYDNSIKEILDEIPTNINLVAHRVVHGGEYFKEATLLDDNSIKKIEELSPLAPLHNPVNLKAIKFIKQHYPTLIQIAVFDTAYHQTIPKKNYIYPIDIKYYEQHHIRKYGFHGTSHNYVANFAAKYLKKDIKNCNFISLHLGNGASVTAIKNGKSYNTSMGFTPLDGLMMGTRSGSIDPSIIFYLEKNINMSIDDIDKLLNKQSGFKGLCGTNDLREVLKKEKNGDLNAKLAIDIFVKRVQEYIVKYILALQNIDGIIFTGGIGENSSYIRELILRNLEIFNIKLDFNKNYNIINDIENINQINQINIFVIKTDEEKEIAMQSKILFKKLGYKQND